MPDISIGRLRGGFCVYWIDTLTGRRVRYQLKARTRKEAEPEALEVYRREYLTRRRVQNPDIRLVWNDYREELGERPTGVNMGYMGKAVLDFFGNYKPHDVTRDLCQKYARQRATEVSQGTIHTELGYLRSALKHAGKMRSIDHVPDVWRPSKPESDKRILTASEASALIGAAHDPHVRLAIILLLGTAARVSAILDLTWDRIDFERGVINLRHPEAINRKGRAILPMNNMTRAALKTAYEARLSDYVVEYGGRKISSIRSGFSAAVERACIGHLRIHDLRHTAAVHMLAAGHPIEKVSQVLGHSNTSITFKTYARYRPEHMSDAVDVLDFTKPGTLP